MRVNVKFFLTFLSWFVFCLLLLISTPDQPRSLRERKKIFHLSTQYLCPDIILACLLAKSLQSCLTLCDPIDSSPPGSPIPGTLQARTLEWVTIAFSNAGRWKVKVKSLSHVWLLATPWTTAYQAPLSMGFSRQEYWSGVPLPSPLMLPTASLLLKFCECFSILNSSSPGTMDVSWGIFFS